MKNVQAETVDTSQKTIDLSDCKTLICPITHEIMRDPVTTVDGQTYERKAIEQWFATKQTSPATGARLESKTLTPNYALRSIIQEFVPRPTVDICVRHPYGTYDITVMPDDTVRDVLRKLDLQTGIRLVAMAINDEVVDSDAKFTEVATKHDSVYAYFHGCNLIYVKDLAGDSERFVVSPQNSVKDLKLMYQRATRIPVGQLRMIFDGKELSDDKTLGSYGIKKESTIHRVLRLRGGCVASPVPVAFDVSQLSTDSPEEIAQSVGGDLAGSVKQSRLLCSIATTEKLRSVLDDKDVVRMTWTELKAKIGRTDAHLFKSVFGDVPELVLFRRVVGTGHGVPFHVDFAVRTMHFPLNTLQEGGEMVFATNEGFEEAPHRWPLASVHEGKVPHATKPFTGERLSLFLCKTNREVTDLADLLVDRTMARLASFRLNGSIADAIRNYGSGLETHDTNIVGQVSRLLPDDTELLEGHVARELSFMASIDREAFATRELTLSIVRRYLGFLRCGEGAVPGDLVDVVWHTHLGMNRYAVDSMSLTGSMLAHVPEPLTE